MRKGQDKQRTHNIQEEQEKQNIFKRASKFVSDHKGEIALATLSVAAVAAKVLLSSDSTDDDASDGKMASRRSYSAGYFRKSSIDELKTERKRIQQDANNPELDFDYRSSCHDLLPRFDNEIHHKECGDREIGYPVHSDGGWHLQSKD